MSRYKVAVYAICKNEEKFADRWMNSMCEADEIYVADTGSSDGTMRALRERGANVNKISVRPWRFDTARNMSLSFVPDDVDICVCTDLDEVFEPGWRKLLEEAWTARTTQLRYTYTWSFNSDGSPGVTFLYEKIHARNGFKWVHPVHEILEYSGTAPEHKSAEPRIHLNHYPDPSKPRGQYLPLLELSVEEAPDDDRNMHYLGREYMFYGMWDKCIAALKRHLSMPSADWADERCASMRFISRAYKAKGNNYEAMRWLYRAIAEAPYLREPYVEMAVLAYTLSDWQCVLHMTDEALKITERPMSYINEAFCWDSTVYDLSSLACYHLGMYSRAEELARIAADMSPDDERIQRNLEIMSAALNAETAAV